MQHDWMKWIPCSMKKWNPIECRGFYAAWLNAVDSFSMIEWSGFFAAWPQTSRLNAMDSMQRGEMHPDWTQCIQCSVAKWIPIQCSGFYEAWPNWSQLNAVDSMHHGAMDPNRMQWNRCSVIECSVFHAEWRHGTQLNAVDFMQHGPKHPIECSGFHVLWLNAVNSMQPCKMYPDWMQWIPYSVIKCSQWHTA